MTVFAESLFEGGDNALVSHIEGYGCDRNLVPTNSVDVGSVVFAVFNQFAGHPVVFFTSGVDTFFVFVRVSSCAERGDNDTVNVFDLAAGNVDVQNCSFREVNFGQFGQEFNYEICGIFKVFFVKIVTAV